MRNDELKKKIVDIIINLEWTDIFGIRHRGMADGLNNAIADTLIAAGIGDVKEAEHRAEVAERALDLCEDAYVLAINGMRTHGISLQAITSDLGVHGFFMQQSEKELAEERKDD